MVAILQEVFPDYKWDDHVLRTAERFIGFLEEYAPRTEPDFAFTTFPAISKSQVVVGDVEFASICKHHLLPFMGKAYVGYIPNNVVVGVSKVPRLIEFFAKRPQTQEELTHQIAEYLNKWLDPVAVAVVMKASHTCMGARGIRKVGAEMTTSVLLGNYLHVPAARDEFFRLAGL
jgi:GTP cyclohydrolase I